MRSLDDRMYMDREHEKGRAVTVRLCLCVPTVWVLKHAVYILMGLCDMKLCVCVQLYVRVVLPLVALA
jgi:hypothetical protein